MSSVEGPTWANIPLDQRLAWLLRFQRLVAANQPRLCQLMEEEVAKPQHVGLMADVAGLLAACKWLHQRGPALLRDRVVGETPFWLMGTNITERRMPLGRIGIIATWNYPVQLLGIQMIHALLPGNTVVVKPSERAPRTQTRLMELAIEAGLPAGTLTWTGSSREAGANMLATQKLDHVIFTGSTEVGQRIAQSVAKTMTPATLELSGRDSAFVLDDADPKHAAKALWAAICINAGQTCMAPRRALVVGNQKVYDKFVAQLAKLAAGAQPVDMIDEYAAQKCKELASKALAGGAVDVAALDRSMPSPQTPGAPIEGQVADETLNRRFKPTVLINCNPTTEAVEGRHFGPLLAVVRCVNLEEALMIHRRCDQHLTASVFGSPKAGQLLAERLGATNVMINDCIMPSAHPGVSIAGRGMSGMGVSRGEEGLLAMTRPLYISTSKRGIATLAKPPSAWQVKMLGKCIRWWYGANKAQQGGAINASGGAGAIGSAQSPLVASTPTGPLPVLDNAGASKPIVHSQQAFANGKRMSGAA